MNPSPRRRKIVVTLTLLALVLPLIASILSAAPATAAGRNAVAGLERAVIKTVKARATRNAGEQVHLRVRGKLVACANRAANQAVNRVNRRGHLPPRHQRALRRCDVGVLETSAVRARHRKAAVRKVRRDHDLTHAAASDPARGLVVAARRNRDRSWSVLVVVVGAPQPAPAPNPEPEPAPAPEPAPEPVPSPDLDAEAQQMREGIYAGTNVERTREGVAEVVGDTCLEVNAQAWAEHLADVGYLEHQDLSTVFDACGDRNAIGENVAYNFVSDGSVMVTQWMDSPGHRRNMLHDSFTRLGVGVATDGNGRWYGVQVFTGDPR